jgi:hypothetical protein
VSTANHHRRALRRAESRLFEAIEAADAGDLELARELLDRAATPRRARPSIVRSERAALGDGQRRR